jgi:hypothetical protein
MLNPRPQRRPLNPRVIPLPPKPRIIYEKATTFFPLNNLEINRWYRSDTGNGIWVVLSCRPNPMLDEVLPYLLTVFNPVSYELQQFPVPEEVPVQKQQGYPSVCLQTFSPGIGPTWTIVSKSQFI